MPIRVLIIDDSLVFREIIARGISTDPNIEVVGKAVDVFDARDQILKHKPDVITCDIQMPKMDGIEFVRRLMPQYPLPIIVVSSVSNRVFDAMEAGAVDFVTKPSASSAENVQNFIIDLIEKIKAASNAKIHKTLNVKTIPESHNHYTKHKLIAIGASTGGTEAIYSLLQQLPLNVPGIVIVQHIPPIFSTMFAERLNKQTHFNVKEAKNGDIVKSNNVYLAPGDQHMEVVNAGGQFKVKLYKGAKVNGHCPSVDVLFNSVAKEYGDSCIGVILTGMGYDGARGITRMKRKGAITFGQDEASSVVYGMPKAAYELGGITKQSSLEHIGHYILKALR